MEILWLIAKTGGRRNFFFRGLLFFILLIFCIFQLNIHKIYGFSVYPDEFGYWACAAEMIGYDWSQAASLGPYYSFGYSLILAPILKIFSNSLTAYRAAVTINMLLQCAAIAMLWGIFIGWYSPKHLEENVQEKKFYVLLAVGCAVFYPAWTFYVQTTLTEALLTFLYVSICYQIILFLKKPKMSGAVLLALSFLYLYFVHMRTVGVVIAGILTLLVYAWKTPSSRRILLAGAMILFLGVVGGLWVKEWMTDNVYAAADFELLAVNDYSGQLRKIKSLFTLRGIGTFFLSCVGKLYYLGMASFGLLYPAISECLKESIKIFGKSSVRRDDIFPEMKEGFPKQKGKQDENQVKEYFCFFCIVSLIGQFLITAIGMIEPGRLDGIVYGRYNEYILPVFMGIGLLVFCEYRHKLRGFLISVVFSTVLFVVTYLNTLHSGLTAMQGYFACGLSYLSDDWHYKIKTDPVKAFILGILLMTFVRGCLFIKERFQKYIPRRAVMGAILTMEILLIVCLQKKYTWLFNDVDYYNLQIYEYIEAYETEQKEKASYREKEDAVQVSYLYGGGLPYIDLIQFAMGDKIVRVIALSDIITPSHTVDVEDYGGKEEWEATFPKEGFLIVDSDCPYLAEIEESYKKCCESKAFILYQSVKRSSNPAKNTG